MSSDFDFAQAVVTTWENTERETNEQIQSSSLFLKTITDKGLWTTVEGGEFLEARLDYGVTSFQYLGGDYEEFAIPDFENITKARYPWRYGIVTIPTSDLRAMRNSGKAQLIDEVEAKVKTARNSMKRQLAADVLSDGTGHNGRQVMGLQSFILDNPATASKIGGIRQDQHWWWQNKALDFSTDLGIATVTKANIKQGMRRLYKKLEYGDEHPDLIVSNSEWYILLEEEGDDKVRFADRKTAESGFEHIVFKGAKVIDDPNTWADPSSGNHVVPAMPDNKMYFLSTDSFEMKVHQGGNQKALQERVSTNQLAKVVPILFMGNMVCRRRNNLGVLTL